ncbi:uncharacterized protein CcaverHIS019_0603800 [Cutaneotrichosporon cavernicola]|uniref:Checkpoint protein n=1 Tax=Cutaneotrichosporon cavernicola TaxID=279322 RepID=A0AA48L877_9TREE|nr:uncharacterized protein CcaverHIS019_0603800 [Cutaneotrichosporon cavernicola]BEI93921.1 hypothetical protein CcaverHIS019_0603800 [Cutaneotrichosporon cavernicola]
MRFRTRISNVALLHKIVRSLAALAKVCVVRLSPDSVHFIVPGNEGRDGVQVWSQVKVPTLFDHFRIESNNNNEIWLEVNLDALLKVLRSADTSSGIANGGRGGNTTLSDADVMVKLNKLDGRPVWTFEISGRTPQGNPITITHNVTVHIISSRRQKELTEPLCPPPDLKTIVSRLGHLAEDVTLAANHNGQLDLRVKANGVQMSTTWNNLRIPTTADAEDTDPHPPEQMFSTTISIRGFQKFLTSHYVSGVAIACICEGHCVIAYVYIGGEIDEAGGVLTFFLPAKNVD